MAKKSVSAKVDILDVINESKRIVMEAKKKSLKKEDDDEDDDKKVDEAEDDNNDDDDKKVDESKKSKKSVKEADDEDDDDKKVDEADDEDDDKKDDIDESKKFAFKKRLKKENDEDDANKFDEDDDEDDDENDKKPVDESKKSKKSVKKEGYDWSSENNGKQRNPVNEKNDDDDDDWDDERVDEDDDEDGDEDKKTVAESKKKKSLKKEGDGKKDESEDDEDEYKNEDLAKYFGSSLGVLFESVESKEDIQKFMLESQEVVKTIMVKAINEEIKKRVPKIRSEMSNKYKRKLHETKNNVKRYLDIFTEQWADDNKVAIAHNTRIELSSSILNGLKSLLEDHYVDIPAAKVDLVDALAAQLVEKTNTLNSVYEQVADLNEDIKSMRKDALVESFSSDKSLTTLNKEKLKSLAEGIEYKNDEDYVNKLNHISESLFAKKTNKQTLNENTVVVKDEPKKNDDYSGERAWKGYTSVLDNL